MTPSDTYAWPGSKLHLDWQSERTGCENNWYSLTWRVRAVEVETDGDLHLVLQDATANLTEVCRL
jgi:hypothetical protein